MFPAAFQLEAFAGAVADAAFDGAELALGHLQLHVDHARFAAAGFLHHDRSNGDAGDEASGEHRAPQVQLVASHVKVAGVETRDIAQVLAVEEVGHVADDAAEIVLAFGPHDHGQVGFVSVVIDQQFRRADGGEGIAAFTQGIIEVALLLDDLVLQDGIARQDLECAAQFFVIAKTRCAGEVSQVDRADLVLRAGNDVEAHAAFRLRALRGIVRQALHAADHLRIVITVHAQHALQQFLVLPRLRGEAGIVRIVVQFLDGGKVPESGDEFVAKREEGDVGGEDQHELVRNPFLRSIGEGRRFEREFGELDILFRLQRLDIRNGELRRPFDVDAGHFRQRAVRLDFGHIVFGVDGFLRHAVFGPGFWVVDGAVGDQVLQPRRGGLVLR